MQKVEEEEVERGKRPQNAGRHHQQQDVKLLFPRLDLRGAQGGGKGDNGPHQNEAHIDAVHADVIADAQRVHPGDLLLELEPIHARHKLAEHFEGQHG